MATSLSRRTLPAIGVDVLAALGDRVQHFCRGLFVERARKGEERLGVTDSGAAYGKSLRELQDAALHLDRQAPEPCQQGFSHFGIHHCGPLTSVTPSFYSSVRVVDRRIADYAPPSLNLLKHSGHGLSKNQAAALQESREVFVLGFRYAPREVFTPEIWKERRLGHWTGPVPDVPFHFTIHLYRSDDLLRAVTLGLGKFGLPDLVVEDLPASASDSVGSLINLTTQSLFEKGRLDAPGKLHVDVDTLKEEGLRGSLSKSYENGATGKADLSLVVGNKDEGDVVNGVLQNEPFEVPGLKAGARVEFRASEAFDYILYQPDGTQHGNGTGEILRRREGKPAPEEKKT